MDATSLIASALAAMRADRLEAGMIGNTAAAIHGAPVTTLDVDFMFRDTPLNLKKLKAVSKELGAMPVVHGIRAFEGLKSRAVKRQVGKEEALLASLSDIIKSKRAAMRQQDLAVLPVLEKRFTNSKKAKVRNERPRKPTRAQQLEALKAESELQLIELIRRRLALPVEQRMNFLRVRLPGGGSAL